ncbi:MAG: Nif3-like dinuclear metal center hexameric protein [Clostridiales bacterium]|nr:Nif3-like dinuclear metal center hexameric protein [Clostridiales bacterium]
MIDKTEFIRVIEQVAPPYLAAEWDNSGIQIEPAVNEIARVLIALEVTSDVIYEAKVGGYDMILVHHPLFFGAVPKASGRNILLSDPAGLFAWRLLAEPPAPVGLYAAHTSFDAAEGGLGDEFRRQIGLMPWDDRLHPDIAAEFSHIAPYTRTGRFPEATDLAGAVTRVRAALGTGADIRVSGDPGRNVLKIMTVCGGGGDAIPLAVKTGCSLLITGDIRHHEWRLAEAEGLALIDAGHYYTERPFARLFAARIAEALGRAISNIGISISAEIHQPYASPAQASRD